MIKCDQFVDYLIRHSEHIDPEIIRGIQPTDSAFIGHVETGVFPAFSGVTHTFNRIDRVFPDLTGGWKAMSAASCIGSPCNPEEKKIGMGYTTDSYTLHEKSYATDLFCFDLIMTADRAKEQFAALVENLGEASVIITTDRLRTQGLAVAGRKWLANAGCTEFTAVWNADETRLTVNGLPTSQLTANMLRRRVQPLIYNGYFGKNPAGKPMLIELLSDMDTLWNMQVDMAIADKWRYTEFAAGASEYFKYGWSGQIGNFAVRCDLFPMRFNKVSETVIERVFPYNNVAGTDGIQSVYNEDYDRAQLQISYLWHVRGMKSLGFSPTAINAAMPFMLRDYAGKWSFAKDNLGADAAGCVIENKRGNKVMGYADFRFATQAQFPLLIEAILHLRDQPTITLVYPSQDDPGYPEQDYNSANDPCPDVLTFTPTAQAADTDEFEILANTITCNGVPIVHAIITAAYTNGDLDALVTQLNTHVSILGVWDHNVGETEITLTGTACSDVVLPFVA